MILPTRLIPTVLLLASLGGCLDVDAVDPPRHSIWEVDGIEPFDLDDPDGPYFLGAAGIISGAGQTELGMVIEHAEPLQEFGWSIRSGSCESSGAPLSTAGFPFPPLVTDEMGEGHASVVLVGNLDEQRDYAAEVFRDPAPNSELLACGTLTLRE